jgi:hypothetical protein
MLLISAGISGEVEEAEWGEGSSRLLEGEWSDGGDGPRPVPFVLVP